MYIKNQTQSIWFDQKIQGFSSGQRIYQKKEYIDYEETFSLTFTFIHLILAIVAHLDPT